MQFNPSIIKQRRQQMGLSQQQVADLVGISKGYISDIENGKKQTISPTTYKKLTEVLAIQEYAFTDRFRLHKALANIACELGLIPEAIQQLSDMAQKFTPFSDVLYDVQFELAKQYYQLNEFGYSQTYCKLAFESARRTGNYVSEYRCMILQSLIDASRGSIHLALERLLLVENSCSKTSNRLPPILYLILYGTLASLYEKINRSTEATTFMKRVESYELKIPNFVSDGTKTTLYLQHLYECASELERDGAMRDAQRMYEACTSIAEWMEQRMYQLTIQLSMAELELRHGNLTKARTAAHSVRSTLEQNGFIDRKLYYEALNLATEIHIQEKNFTSAAGLAHKVFEACQEHELSAAAMAKRNQALIYLKQEKDVRAYEACMREAIRLVSKEQVSQFRGLIKDVTLQQTLQHEYLDQKRRIQTES